MRECFAPLSTLRCCGLFLAVGHGTLCGLSAPANAENTACDLVGVWSLTSLATENLNTHEWGAPYGEKPVGYVVVTPQRFTALIAAQHPLPDRPDRASVSVRAYTGPYWLDGDRLTVRVQVAWNESWVGKDHFHLVWCDDNKLLLHTVPGASIFHEHPGMLRDVLELVRTE